MRKTYTVINGVKNGSEIRFLLEEDSSGHEVKAGGQLITDSEKNAFVYLMDDTVGYTHIQFPKAVWSLLADSLVADKEPVLVWGKKDISLDNFREELNMLIFNIEGNHNYGEEFSTAVEEVFKERLSTQ
ncbi:hypothetical protein [Paenisporosarcina sp. TG20]|uniref:UPF0738 family protein n=1 Tax=Paenisporosarcina sp. TG20 TaxID=1211706 RepID=UPI0002F06732|nr:hypothetical protein [Paenisporosarcina sp. TG20]